MPAWPLTLVISGGQTGADQAGVSAAKFLNYRTGGRAPKGWATEEGPAPWLAEFGLQASPVDSLRSRTYHNVLHADATVIFTKEVLDPKALGKKKQSLIGPAAGADREAIFRAYGLEGGSLYTAQLAIAHRKHLIICPTKQAELRQWIYECQIKILNVAGSRESKAPGIFDWVYKFLLDALVPF